MTDSARPLISILVLALNKVMYSRRCLESLLSMAYRPLELVLVDNGSTDGTPDYFREVKRRAESAGIRVRMRRNESNVGAVTGRNQGLEQVTGEFVVFMDNDVVVRTRSWAERMLREFQRRPEVGAVCAKMLFPFEPFLIQYAGLVISPTGRPDYLGRGRPKDDPAFNARRELQATISACMMIPAAVIRDVGPLDEQFNPVQFEDIDYSYRIRQLGRTVVYLPEVEMYHFENVTTDNTPGLGFKRQTIVNGMKFQRKWRHVFSKEGGPPATQMHWEDLPRKRFDEIGELETTP
jgi:GT2 family glycosyltransferase